MWAYNDGVDPAGYDDLLLLPALVTAAAGLPFVLPNPPEDKTEMRFGELTVVPSAEKMLLSVNYGALTADQITSTTNEVVETLTEDEIRTFYGFCVGWIARVTLWNLIFDTLEVVSEVADVADVPADWLPVSDEFSRQMHAIYDILVAVLPSDLSDDKAKKALNRVFKFVDDFAKPSVAMTREHVDVVAHMIRTRTAELWRDKPSVLNASEIIERLGMLGMQSTSLRPPVEFTVPPAGMKHTSVRPAGMKDTSVRLAVEFAGIPAE